MIVNADSREYLKLMIAFRQSVDSIVTDPPYGLVSTVKRFGKEGSAPAKSEGATGVYARASAGFMGQKWDGTGIEQDPEFWRLCYDVLKPGGYLLAFGGTRTWHRIAVAIEDAGFEKRDTIMWLYGTGFPKSHDVSKGIEAKILTGGSGPKNLRQRDMGDDYRPHDLAGIEDYGKGRMSRGADTDRDYKNAPPVTTPEAAQWQGWGTALKPAWEPIMVFRKPLEGTVAANVLAHGTGALNIDGCRVEGAFVSGWSKSGSKASENRAMSGANYARDPKPDAPGRWPANVMHDGSPEVTSAFPAAPGQQGASLTEGRKTDRVYGAMAREGESMKPRGDAGSAARFFYCAKATKNDRNTDWRGEDIGFPSNHPTVKPTALMQWLVRLVTPPGGTVLDPFAGSGSTGKACRLEGFEHIGIEADPQFASIAARRSGSDFQSALNRLAAAIARNEEARRG